MAGKSKPTGVKPSQVLSVITDAGPDLNIERLAEELLDAFGGAKEFGLLLKAEYDKEGATSIARSNILQAVLRVITQAANKKSGNQDLSGIATEDLQAQAAGLMRRFFGPGAVDAAPQAQPKGG